MTASEMDIRIDTLQDLEAQKKALEELIEAQKDGIKKAMDALKLDALDTGKHKVSYKLQERERFDSKTFKAEQGDLYSRYTVKDCFTVLRVA